MAGLGEATTSGIIAGASRITRDPNGTGLVSLSSRRPSNGRGQVSLSNHLLSQLDMGEDKSGSRILLFLLFCAILHSRYLQGLGEYGLLAGSCSLSAVLSPAPELGRESDHANVQQLSGNTPRQVSQYYQCSLCNCLVRSHLRVPRPLWGLVAVLQSS